MKDPYRDYDSKLAAAFLNSYQLPITPGKSQDYSNLGVSILGYLIAEKSGKSYEELLQERIAKPLKMADFAITLSSDQTKRFATPHDKFGSEALPWTFSDLPGAGGIRATITDMMHFAKAQLNPPKGPLGEAIDLAWKQHTEADESGAAMGLGWMISADGLTRVHNGQTGGFHSIMYINRKFNCAVIVLCNTAEGSGVDKLAETLIQKAGAGAALKQKAKTAEATAVKAAIDGKHRSRLVGRYQLAPDFIFDVTDRDGHLMVGVTNQPTLEVFPDSPTRWSYRGVKAMLEFSLPKTGPAKSLVLHQNGAKQTALRIDD
jgi:CubicO group peptidase (beta-lactamase class C family)